MPENDTNDSESLEQELEEQKENVAELQSFVTNTKYSAIKKDPIEPVLGEKGATERDYHYTRLLGLFLKNYNTEKQQTLIHKQWFLKAVIAVFVLIGVSGIVLLFLALFVDSSNGVAVIIGACVEIFSAFIAIPIIIAKNLFPEKLDTEVIEIVKVLIDNDKDIRGAKEHRFHDKHK